MSAVATPDSLDSMEGLTNHTVIMADNGWQFKSFMVQEEGKTGYFRCDCGCNCFHKYHDEPDAWYCNSCDTKWS